MEEAPGEIRGLCAGRAGTLKGPPTLYGQQANKERGRPLRKIEK